MLPCDTAVGARVLVPVLDRAKRVLARINGIGGPIRNVVTGGTMSWRYDVYRRDS